MSEHQHIKTKIWERNGRYLPLAAVFRFLLSSVTGTSTSSTLILSPPLLPPLVVLPALLVALVLVPVLVLGPAPGVLVIPTGLTALDEGVTRRDGDDRLVVLPEPVLEPGNVRLRVLDEVVRG